MTLFGNELRLHIDPFAAVLGFAGRNEIAALHSPAFADPELSVRVEHDRRIHAWLARRSPFAIQTNERRKIGGREEAVGQNPVGGSRGELRIGATGEAQVSEVGGKKGSQGFWGFGVLGLWQLQTTGLTLGISFAGYSNATGSRSSVILSPASFGTLNRSRKYRLSRVSSFGCSALTSTCQRQRFLMRSTGHGAGPTSTI